MTKAPVCGMAIDGVAGDGDFGLGPVFTKHDALQTRGDPRQHRHGVR